MHMYVAKQSVMILDIKNILCLNYLPWPNHILYDLSKSLYIACMFLYISYTMMKIINTGLCLNVCKLNRIEIQTKVTWITYPELPPLKIISFYVIDQPSTLHKVNSVANHC